MTDYENLYAVFSSGQQPCITICTHEEEYAIDVICRAALELKREILVWSASEGVKASFLWDSPAMPATQAPHEALAKFETVGNQTICVMLDVAHFLRDNRTLRALRDVISRFEMTGSTLVLLDSCAELPDIVHSYSRKYEISLPTSEELSEIVRTTILRLHKKKPLQIGITKTGFDAIIRNLRGLSRRQAQRVIIDTVSEDRTFQDSDLNDIIAAKRQMVGSNGLLEYVRTPLDLSEIGGMKKLKHWLGLRTNSFTPQAAAFGIKAPRGMLMLGVQGAGKSLCAKAVATAWQQPLLRLDPSVLYSRYIGDSEDNLRKALAQAEAMSPVILWIDEIEKAFASAASHSSDGGLSQRMFGTLLTWMQEKTSPVFIIATANNIEALPPELLRKGRFDEIFFVDLPGTEARQEIFKIHISKCKRDAGAFDLQKLAKVSAGYSGAEIEQAILSALYEAYACKAELNDENIAQALKNSPPISVTMAESINTLLEWSKGRCVPVD
ncbi:MAG: hypothetical protein A2Y07_05775 [Planctomycetes bacterium GWF2_50_10]|nr:MAG: hypothetical protein A2Y07_05775 [Planctomycetes bacterium GWF2_50_10]